MKITKIKAICVATLSIFIVLFGWTLGYTLPSSTSSSDSSPIGDIGFLDGLLSEMTTLTGYVNTSKIDVKDSKLDDSKTLGKLNKGDRVEVTGICHGESYRIKYNNKHGFINGKYVDIVKSGESIDDLNNFLFIGDSFTELMKDTIKSNTSNVYVCSKSGSRPSYWLNRVPLLPSNSDIDGVVLLIGVNGASSKENREDIKKLINKLSSKYYNKTIYIQKIFPVGNNLKGVNEKIFNKKIDELNKVIRDHCNITENAVFIDTQKGLVKDELLHDSYDGLHISDKYNDKFYDNILGSIRNSNLN